MNPENNTSQNNTSTEFGTRPDLVPSPNSPYSVASDITQKQNDTVSPISRPRRRNSLALILALLSALSVVALISIPSLNTNFYAEDFYWQSAIFVAPMILAVFSLILMIRSHTDALKINDVITVALSVVVLFFGAITFTSYLATWYSIRGYQDDTYQYDLPEEDVQIDPTLDLQ